MSTKEPWHSKKNNFEYFQKVFLRRIQCGRIVCYVSKMTFQDGVNRPPRRQSTKNIDFRRLADVNDDDEKEYFTVDIKKCRICQQIVDKNKSIQVRPYIFSTCYSENMKCQLKLMSLNYLKVLPDESRNRGLTLILVFSNFSVQHNHPMPT